MKKLASLLLVLLMCFFALSSCGDKDEPEKTSDGTAVIRIGYMSGPTGIGMAKLINDNKGNDAKYTFTKFEDTTLAHTALLSGEIDAVCLPTNEAAKFYNTVNDELEVLAINCLNSLQLLTGEGITLNSIEDLEGKTIYTCKNGTPKIILEKLLSAYGVNATISHQIGSGDTALILNKPQDLPPIIVGNKADIVLAPEPIVSTALSKPQTKHKVSLDIGELWDAKFSTPIAMGCIVINEEFADNYEKEVNNFLIEYKKSIEYVSDPKNLETAAGYVVDAGILADATVAKSALTNLGDAIAYVDGREMKTTLVNIYNIFGMNVIGGRLPDDDFYHDGD